eukprot:s5517_g2.t1
MRGQGSDDGEHREPTVVDLRIQALHLLLRVLNLLAEGEAEGAITVVAKDVCLNVLEAKPNCSMASLPV